MEESPRRGRRLRGRLLRDRRVPSIRSRPVPVHGVRAPGRHGQRVRVVPRERRRRPERRRLRHRGRLLQRQRAARVRLDPRLLRHARRLRLVSVQRLRCVLVTLVPVRPRRRGERRSLRTFSPGVVSPPITPRFQSRRASTPFNSALTPFNSTPETTTSSLTQVLGWALFSVPAMASVSFHAASDVSTMYPRGRRLLRRHDRRVAHRAADVRRVPAVAVDGALAVARGGERRGGSGVGGKYPLTACFMKKEDAKNKIAKKKAAAAAAGRDGDDDGANGGSKYEVGESESVGKYPTLQLAGSSLRRRRAKGRRGVVARDLLRLEFDRREGGGDAAVRRVGARVRHHLARVRVAALRDRRPGRVRDRRERSDVGAARVRSVRRRVGLRVVFSLGAAGRCARGRRRRL